jgi:UDP-glucose 4-epimerase
MKILVTGGTGYIGSHTVVELQQSGYEVLVIDDLSNSYIGVLDSIQKITGESPYFEKIDLTERKPVMAFFERHRDIDGVIHFAASKSVKESVNKPLHYYRNNLNSLMNVLEGMQIAHIPNLVFSSSCTVYGQPDQLPVTEHAPFKPAVSPYGNTKQVCEAIIHDYLKNTAELKCISLRYFNPIGAHSSALIGELPIGVPENLIPFITQTAIGKREVLNVYGNDYDTPDGTAIRDYLHVVDLAGAHLSALDRMISGRNKKQTEVFNIGTGKGCSVLDVIYSFEKMSGIELNYRMTGRRPGDVEKVWADTSLPNTELKWQAKKSLDEMTLSAWNWEKAINKNNYSFK